MDMRDLVGRNFRRIRLAKGLTQETLAERSGFSQQYLSDLERGRRNPTAVTLFELAQALGASHLDLVAVEADTRFAVTPWPAHAGVAEKIELVNITALTPDQVAQSERISGGAETVSVSADPRRRPYVLLELDRVVGWIVAFQSHPNAWRIDGLAVAPADLGRGVEEKLVGGLEQAARDAGMLTLYANASDDGFYGRLGYDVVGRLPNAQGPDKPGLWVAKPLEAAR